MPSRISFKPIIVENPELGLIDSFELESSEVYILWALGKDGPANSNKLSEQAKDKILFPMPLKSIYSSQIKQLNHHITGEKRSFSKSTLIESFERLKQKGLLITFNLSDKRELSTLSAHGFIWYLENFGYIEAFKELEKLYSKFSKKPLSNERYLKLVSYQKTFPMIHLWHNLVNALNEELCLKKLAITIDNFNLVQKKKFHIKQLNPELEGFLKLRNNYDGVNPNYFKAFPHAIRISQVTDFLLKNKEPWLYSYLAFLITHDLAEAEKLNGKELTEKLSLSMSKSELLYFEDLDLKDFLKNPDSIIPNFTAKFSLEFFFMGMFVYSLLWNVSKTNNPF